MLPSASHCCTRHVFKRKRVYSHLSVKASIDFFSSICHSSSFVRSDQMAWPLLHMCTGELWVPRTLLPVHWLSFLGPILIGTSQCIPRIPHNLGRGIMASFYPSQMANTKDKARSTGEQWPQALTPGMSFFWWNPNDGYHHGFNLALRLTL